MIFVCKGKLLQAVQKFGSNLEDYLHLLLPPIVKLFDAIDVNINVRRTALETVDLISDTLDLSDFASRIIQPLVRCIENTSELRPVAMETLASLVAQLGKKYLIFIPMVQKVLVRHRIQHQRYDVLVAKILHVSGNLLPFGPKGDILMLLLVTDLLILGWRNGRRRRFIRSPPTKRKFENERGFNFLGYDCGQAGKCVTSITENLDWQLFFSLIFESYTLPPIIYNELGRQLDEYRKTIGWNG